MGKGINVIQVNCDPSAANDKSLPRDSYLVAYGIDNDQQYDIVQGLQSDIFDHYWDKYRDVRGLKWTEGTVNPKMWGYTPTEKKKKK
jgi:hypothetical protein